MINSIEKCVAWSVQIAQGSLESAQTTINRAQRLHALIDDWIEGVEEVNRHRADPRRNSTAKSTLKTTWQRSASR